MSLYMGKWRVFLEKKFSLILFLCVVLMLLPSSPFISKVPGQDSGVFLYAGQEILNGYIPYRDFWDHKGPIIYFINALGLVINNHTVWGVWILRVFFLTVSFRIIYSLIKKTYGLLPAAFATILAIIVSPILFGGFDSTEEYSLLPQALSLYFITKAKIQKIDLFIIGCLSSVCFLLRPNLMGIGIAITIYLFYEGFKNKDLLTSCKKSIVILVGFLISTLLMILYLYYNSALQNFWEQVFVYNMGYSKGVGVSIYERIKVVLRGLRTLNALGLLSIYCWFGVVFSKKFARNRLLIIAAIAFFVEVSLSSISGRTYNHYFITWLPSASILSAGVIAHLLNQYGRAKIGKVVMVSSLILALILSLHYQKRTFSDVTRDQEPLAISQYIKTVTSPEEYVLIWGPSATLNFLSERRSPTKYFYQLPLYSVGVDNDKMINEFFEEIKAKKPALIIDDKAKLDQHGEIPTIADDKVSRAQNGPYQAQEAIYKITAYIRSNYEQQNFGGYTIYMRKDRIPVQ